MKPSDMYFVASSFLFTCLRDGLTSRSSLSIHMAEACLTLDEEQKETFKESNRSIK